MYHIYTPDPNTVESDSTLVFCLFFFLSLSQSLDLAPTIPALIYNIQRSYMYKYIPISPFTLPTIAVSFIYIDSLTLTNSLRTAKASFPSIVWQQQAVQAVLYCRNVENPTPYSLRNYRYIASTIEITFYLYLIHSFTKFFPVTLYILL